MRGGAVASEMYSVVLFLSHPRSQAAPTHTFSAVVDEVAATADRIGLKRIGMTRSPINGAEGNHEFFLHFRI